MLKNLIQSHVEMEDITGTSYSSAFDMTDITTLSVQAFVDVNTPSPETFEQNDVNIVDNTFPTLATQFTLGLKVRATSTGTLPAGITTGVDYYVIPFDDDNIQLADSLAHALAGTAVNITDTGTADAVGTFTPQALAGATISFQRSNVRTNGFAPTDATKWDDIDTATSISADGHLWFTKVGPEYRWFRVKGVVTSGQMAFDLRVLGRGSNKY